MWSIVAAWRDNLSALDLKCNKKEPVNVKYRRILVYQVSAMAYFRSTRRDKGTKLKAVSPIRNSAKGDISEDTNSSTHMYTDTISWKKTKHVQSPHLLKMRG